jgi:hypothetical protein
MKDLILQHLIDQGITEEDYSVQFLRFTTKCYEDENGDCVIQFPVWKFNCDEPSFTSAEIKDALKADYIEAHTDGIEVKYANDEVTKTAKISELNALTDLDDIKNYTY